MGAGIVQVGSETAARLLLLLVNCNIRVHTTVLPPGLKGRGV